MLYNVAIVKLLKINNKNMGMEGPFGNVPAQEENIVSIESLKNSIDQLQEQFGSDSLGFNQALASLYMEAARKDPQWKESAADALYDAATLANQEGGDSLRDELLEKMTEFK
ncbi:MAG: hypothetical protein NT041_00755 [Candidatus Vogelbacteria bacterium]|nr:hypothetical protein [Candidatus Vogelbacteria bacterium]